MTDGDAIVLRDLVFRWTPARPVLDIPQLEIGRGEHVFLHGGSGSGKSTLLGVIAGISVPAAGEVRVLGNALTRMRAWQRDALRARDVGMIFQMFNLIPFLSVRENILLGCAMAPGRRARAAMERPLPAEADRLLEALGLQPAVHGPVPAAELSVGQQQRVAAARALIGAPALVIADEPTSALDDATASAFLDLLTGEVQRSAATLLFVSHDRRLARHFHRRLDLAQLNRVVAESAA